MCRLIEELKRLTLDTSDGTEFRVMYDLGKDFKHFQEVLEKK